jgi:hypothetical protein
VLPFGAPRKSFYTGQSGVRAAAPKELSFSFDNGYNQKVEGSVSRAMETSSKRNADWQVQSGATTGICFSQAKADRR